jgi:hypothetical protein
MANQTIPAIQVKDSNVGIGTVSPGAKLVVSGSAVEAHISNGDTNTLTLGNFSGGRHFIKSINLGVALTPLTLQASSFTFDTGNVGIGTTSPVSPFDVNGIISSRGIYIAQNSGTYNVIYNASNSVAIYLGGSADPGNYYDNNTHYFRNSGGSTTYAIITSTGNVGIGTTSPAHKLDVFGSGRFQLRNDSNEIMDLAVLTEPSGLSKSKLSFLWYGNETASIKYVRGTNSTGGEIEFWTQPEGGSIAERMTILSNGNVGIGATVPSQRLTVGNSDSDAILINAGGKLYLRDTTTYISEGSGLNIVSGASRSINLSAGGSERMRILTGGDVAIGQTTASYKLHVNGTVGSTGIMYASSFNGINTDLNTFRNNLGNPTVEEMALFHGQFANKFRFIPPTLQEQSTDGVTWTTSTRATTNQLGDLMIGQGQVTNFNAIPADTIGVYGGYRLTWDVVGITGYIFLNNLYVYNSTNGNNVTVKIERFHNTTGWETVTSGNANTWPGHTSVRHTSIPYSSSASQYSRVRVSFETTHNAFANPFTLYAIEWFGGYFVNKRNAESYDRDRNVTFPSAISGTRLISTIATGTAPFSVNSTTVSGNLNADMVDGYHSTGLWRSDGGIWNPGANITLGQTANNQEWSFDITRNGFTGGYWHVWDSVLSTMLRVDAVTGKVSAPYNFVGNLEGNATTATSATSATTADSSPLLSALGDYVFTASTNGRSFSRGIQTSFVSASEGYPEYGSVVRIRTYTGANDGGTAELYFPYSSQYGGTSMRYRLGQYSNAGWTGWKTVIDSDNIGAQSVSYATTAGALTSMNISQFTNNSGYITGYTETDTLASVTGRGATTTTTLNLGKVITTGLYGQSLGGNNPIWQYDASNLGYGIIYNEGSPDTLRIDVSGQAVTGTPDFLVGPDYAQVNGNTVWHAGNDGTGSGLDADLLDGNHASAFYLATNPSGYTSNTGTVTSVAGTGTVSGLTLTGTVTTSGSLTLGGTLTLTSTQVTTALGYTPYNSTNPNGYTSNTGTVTSVSGTGTVNGITLTGTVTSSGSLTLGGTLSGIGNSQLTNSSITVGTTAISLGSSATTITGLSSVTSTTFVGALTGNASTATSAATLTTARNINGTSFDGSADITTANWGTARTITIGSTGKSLNGSANVAWTLTEIGAAAASHNHTSLTGVTSIGFAAEASDVASISTTISSTSTFFDFNLTDDNSNDEWRWRFTPSGATVYNAMRLIPVTNTTANLVVSGTIAASNFSGTSSGTNTGDQTTITGNAGSATVLATARTLTIGSTGKTFNGSANVSWSLAEIGAQAAGSYLTAEADTLATVTARGATTSTALTIQGGWASTILNGDNVVVRKPNYPSGGWARTLLNFQEYTTVSLYQIGAYGDGNTFIYGYLGVTYNDTMMRWYPNKNITIDGNVGIGTTSPGSQLQVGVGTGNQPSPVASLGGTLSGILSALSLVNTSGNAVAGYGTALDFHVNSGYSPTGRIATIAENTGTEAALAFYTYNSGLNEKMRITSAGNVGIGTTSPTVTLEVSGRGLITSSGSSDTFAVTHSSGSGIGVNITKGGNGEGLYVNKTSGSGNAVTIVGTLNATTLVKSGGTSAQYLMADGSVSTLTNPVTGTGTTNYVSKWASGSAIGNSQVFDDGTYVGIGTASPMAKLHVVGTILAESTLSFNSIASIYQNSNSNLVINNPGWGFSGTGIDITAPGAITIQPGSSFGTYFTAGNVGIGTTSPSFKTTISADITKSGDINPGTAQLSLEGATTPGKRMILGYDTNSNGFGFIKAGNYGVTWTPLSLQPDGGNVGIGNTGPSEKLHVSGNIRVTGAYYDSANSAGTSGQILSSTATGTAWIAAPSGGGVSGSGTATRVAFWSAASTLTSSSNLFWDNTNSRLGIGTTSPSAKVHLVEGNFVTRFLVGQSTFTGYNSGLTAGQKGNIIVGQANSTNNAYVINFIYQGNSSTSNSIGLGFFNNDDIVTISANKNVAIATTPTTGYTLTVGSIVGGTGTVLTKGSVKIETGALGVGVNASATAGRIDASNDIVPFSSSDLRLKENVQNITDPIEKIKKLNGIEFDWIQEFESAHGYTGHDTGVIAQEVQEVLPTAVRTNASGYLAVRYEKLIGLLIEAVKEQQTQIDDLKSKLDGFTS